MPIKHRLSPLQLIPDHPGKKHGITLFIKRDDLLHPEIQGSKLRKLLAIMPLIQSSYPGGLVTFGGAFSNHLHAVALAGRLSGIPTHGILRGEHMDLQNPTLQFCRSNGMTLYPIAKSRYDAGKDAGGSFFSEEFPDCFFLPEGGNTPQGVASCAAIPGEIVAQLEEQHPAFRQQSLYLCTPAGTGCTAAGIVAGLSELNSEVLIFPVSRHGLDEAVIRQLAAGAGVNNSGRKTRFHLLYDYTFGGFAKLHPPVMDFVRRFYQQTNILLDPVYTAKMCFGIFDLLEKGHFQAGSTIVVLHTGGQQGWDGFSARYGKAGSPQG